VTITRVGTQRGRAVDGVARPVELRAGIVPVPRRIDGDLVLPASLPGTPSAAS
jgi:hypothetical protein